MAREAGPDAIKALKAALQDPKQRVPAAVALLDRGFDRPRQSVEMEAAVRNVIGNVIGGIDAPETPEDEETWLARRRTELAVLRRPNEVVSDTTIARTLTLLTPRFPEHGDPMVR